MLYLCTYFNINYLDRGIALYNSLKMHSEEFTLYVLCLDDATEGVLTSLELSNVRLISLKELEDAVIDLLEVKGSRTLIEYYFTCTSVFLWFLLNTYDIEMITYLDSDLCFFSSLNPIYQEMGDNSVFITSHNFPNRLEHLKEFGEFNVGLLVFRNDKSGRECLEWWKERCIEWCYDRVEGDRFADQKYLDQFQKQFPNVIVSKNKGIGVAPWNIERYSIHKNLTSKSIMVDDETLIFYHYQGVKKVNSYIYRLGLASYQTQISNKTRRTIYGPYIDELQSAISIVQATDISIGSLGTTIRFGQLKNSKSESKVQKKFRDGITATIDNVASLLVGDSILNPPFLTKMKRWWSNHTHRKYHLS